MATYAYAIHVRPFHKYTPQLATKARLYRFIARPSDGEQKFSPYFCQVKSMSTIDVEMGSAVNPCAAKSRSAYTWERGRGGRGAEGGDVEQEVRETRKGVAEREAERVRESRASRPLSCPLCPAPPKAALA